MRLYCVGLSSCSLRLYKRSLYHSRFDEMQYNYELMDEHRSMVTISTHSHMCRCY